MRSGRTVPQLVWLAVLIVALSGCAGGGWGGDTGFARSWQAWGAAARDAATQPAVWMPLGGAIVLGAADLDDNISDWAVRKQPLFGNNASDVSDDLLHVTTGALVLSAVVAPADKPADRFRGVAAQLASVVVTGAATEGLKELTSRERPNGRGNKSLPSGHASQAAVRTSLARTNLRHHDLPRGARIVSDVALHSLGYATAWARVEANRHYPSDVLAGVALGNFFAEFLRLALFEGRPADGSQLTVDVMPGGAAIQLSMPLP